MHIVIRVWGSMLLNGCAHLYLCARTVPNYLNAPVFLILSYMKCAMYLKIIYNMQTNSPPGNVYYVYS